jgi:hypothetical protein
MFDANDSDFGDDNEKAESTGASANVVAAPSPKMTTTKPTKRLLSKKAVVLKDTYDIVFATAPFQQPERGVYRFDADIDSCHSMDLAGAMGAMGRLEAGRDRGTFLVCVPKCSCDPVE